MMKNLILSLFLTLSTLLPAAPAPPGTVIHHSPASSRQYIGSPTLCVLPNGEYLAAHDLFGPGTVEHETAKGRLYRSTDKGATWQHEQDFVGYFWSNLFVHRGNVYLMGTNKHHGLLIIRRSEDNGKTWSPPTTILDGQWHTAPMPVIEHKGRLWRAFEDAHTSKKWGERYRARMISAPADADLLDPSSWTVSNAIARDPSWLDGKFNAWLEGNAVATPEGKIVNILRVDIPNVPEKAAIVEISDDGTKATFDPQTGFVDFPGGAKKFTIRKDPTGDGYWALASIIPEKFNTGTVPGGIRNTLALLHSPDLRKWETRCILLQHPDVGRHGFQYVDWHFDGEDIIAVCRTAFDDGIGGAHNNHDANFMTFHRWENFRKLTRKDDVPMPELGMDTTHTAGPLSIRGTTFQIATFEDGAKAFANRDYTLLDVPAEYTGKSFTRLNGGDKGYTEVTTDKDTTLTIATGPGLPASILSEWKPTEKQARYSDSGKTTVSIYTRDVKAGQTLLLPSGNWTGSLLLFREK